ncbi:two-partner secretion domain-containing protein [Egbenema bharatensis]|uniref:two-partner secretion domain-containing protein n=1 Tax=Egbenema bharatensis TaxID=3463334 RepID=UPI003A84120F
MHWRDRLCPFGLVSVTTLAGWALGLPGMAQPVPDGSLGVERSEVIPLGGSSFDIGGGASRGANLFHSFQEFGVENGGSVYFLNPVGIENILSRVTGNNPSNILGSLGVRGGANLFLMNPNGIVFGPNARLDVQGSFAATTADAIGFGEQGVFSAIDPQVPPLLTVNPSAFFFNQIAAQPITQIGPPNQTNAAGYIEGLRVPDGRSLLLLGGQINIQDGRLRASGGRLELGGVARTGAVGLEINGNQLSLNFPRDLDRADISITGLADIDVTGGGGGGITMYARNLNILDGSDVCAGIGPTASCGSQTSNFGTVDSQAGDIVLDAQGTIRIADSVSEVTNSVNNESLGNGGNVFVQADSLFLTNAGQIRASVFGQGNAGNIIIDVRNQIVLAGTSTENVRSGIFSTIVPRGIGNGGNIEITTDSLSLRDGGIINAGTFGRWGTAGNVNIYARGDISLDGMNRSRTSPSGIFSTMEGTRGQSGDIRIFASSLSFTGGAQLVTRTFGEGNAGNVFVWATDSLSFRGRVPGFTREGERDVFSSGILTDNISGQGNAGVIDIAADSISISAGAQLTNITFGEGDASRINIQADRISINGTGPEIPEGRAPSGAFSQVGRRRVVGGDGRGDGGQIDVTTRLLSLTNGGLLSTSTFAQGNAGDIIVRADRISIDGISIDGRFPSGIFSSVSQGAIGNGGNIQVVTRLLLLTNGGQINASTFEQGSAGNIFIHAHDHILLDGVSSNRQFQSGVFSAVEQGAVGRGGNITINATDLSLTDRASISAASQAIGEAGNIRIQLDRHFSSTDSTVVTAAEQSFGGNITLQASDIRLFGDSDILTNSAIDGGNITLRANSILAFGDSDIIAAAGQRGGDITLDTPVFFGEGFIPDSATADPDTLDGNDRVDINASGQISSGNISIPDTSFVQDSLADLPESAIDTESLIASSCVVRSQETEGTFIITGRGGLPERPGDGGRSVYATGEVRSIPETSQTSWQMGDPIVEPQGLYQLEDGRMVLSQECD